MPFSHHSHSGQFCPGHARNSLEDMLQTAISKKMQVFALTEHMPRHEEDFYPEELETHTFDSYMKSHDEYFHEAVRLRNKYESKIEIPIGFESEWIRPNSFDLIQQSLNNYAFDFFVGSVHHVHTVPIDYDQDDYLKARHVAGGTDESLFEDYFDAQYAMLQAVNPPVIGHLDLIRLKSDDPNQTFQQFPGVWQRILRNLGYIASYGGLLELNFASLRKGMREPYPKVEVCEAFLERGGRFCLSDDSHGIDHVALNYDKVLNFLETANISQLHFLGHASNRLDNPSDPRFPFLLIESVEVEDLKRHAFWTHALHPTTV